MNGMPDCGADSAAYVLGALDPEELEAYRLHLRTCSVCQEEVASMQQLADALPSSVPAYALSRRVRRQVLAEVRADARPRDRRVPAVAQWRPAWTRSLPGLPAPGLALAMVAALAVAVIVGIQVGDSRSNSTHVYGASIGHASIRVSDGHGELIVNRLARPSGTNIYEVWLKRPGRPVQATSALFSVTRAGRGSVDVPGHHGSGDEVMVTQEPAGGTSQPTTDPVVVASIS
jgi:anti-sigma factor RsiW